MNIISKMNKPPASGSLSQVVLCTLVFDIRAPVFWSKVHVSAICSPFTPICSFQGEDLGSSLQNVNPGSYRYFGFFISLLNYYFYITQYLKYVRWQHEIPDVDCKTQQWRGDDL